MGSFVEGSVPVFLCFLGVKSRVVKESIEKGGRTSRSTAAVFDNKAKGSLDGGINVILDHIWVKVRMERDVILNVGLLSLGDIRNVFLHLFDGKFPLFEVLCSNGSGCIVFGHRFVFDTGRRCPLWHDPVLKDIVGFGWCDKSVVWNKYLYGSRMLERDNWWDLITGSRGGIKSFVALGGCSEERSDAVQERHVGGSECVFDFKVNRDLICQNLRL